MKQRFLHRLVPALVSGLVLLVSGFASAAAPTFKAGDAVDMQGVTTAEWIQGEGPKSFEPGKLYLFECWATWCCGCVANIPHLNELHQKFHGKGLMVYGMDVWEDEKDKVVKFVAARGAGMSYPVAITGKGSPFDKNWLKASRQRSIPHVFLVKDGKLVLSCAPSYFKDDIVAALLDPATFDATVERIASVAHPESRFDNARFDFDQALARKDLAVMDAALAECEAAKPGNERLITMKLDRCIAAKDWPGALKFIESLPRDAAHDKQLRKIASRMANSSVDLGAPEFSKGFIRVFADSLKAPKLPMDSRSYVALSVLQWRAGLQDEARASAEQALAQAKLANAEEDPAAAFEKFSAELKAGRLPTMGEFSKWAKGME